MTRREFLRTGAVSTVTFCAAPAWCIEDSRPKPTDADIVAATRDSIERFRKSAAIIRVEGARGEPVPGAKVTVEQTRHDFLFGCNLFLFGRGANPEQEQAYRERFAALFNYATLGFYWSSYEPVRGNPNYEYTDQVLEWTKAQSITCKGHPLVWDHPAGSPPWLPEDPADIAPLVTARVSDIVSRYRGRIDLWDVVNEATHLPKGVNRTKMAAWGAALGPVPYTKEPLRIARAANPRATLLVNDYRTDSPYLQILQRLGTERDSYFMDAIGIQSHMHNGVWPLHQVNSVCDTYARLGLPVHFTETTILSRASTGREGSSTQTTPEDEAGQAEYAANFYTALFACPAVQALTWWDLSDYHAWQRAPAGLLRSDMSPKPAYERLSRLIKGEWWTKTESVSDAKGTVNFRGFHGSYRLTAEHSGVRKTSSDVHLRRGPRNEFTLTL